MRRTQPAKRPLGDWSASIAQDEVEQRRCVELAAAELRQILGGKRLPRGGVYVPGPKPGMGGPPQVGSCVQFHLWPPLHADALCLHVKLECPRWRDMMCLHIHSLACPLRITIQGSAFILGARDLQLIRNPDSHQFAGLPAARHAWSTTLQPL